MSSPDQLVYKLIRSGVIISLDLVIENRIRIPASIRRAGKRDGLERHASYVLAGVHLFTEIGSIAPARMGK